MILGGKDTREALRCQTLARIGEKPLRFCNVGQVRESDAQVLAMRDAAREPADHRARLVKLPLLRLRRRCDFAEEAVVGLVVDLGAVDAERLPPPQALLADVSGVKLPRIPVGAGYAALPLVIAALTMADSSCSPRHPADCSKGFGNHMRPSIATE